jgi:hypothetical protein
VTGSPPNDHSARPPSARARQATPDAESEGAAWLSLGERSRRSRGVSTVTRRVVAAPTSNAARRSRHTATPPPDELEALARQPPPAGLRGRDLLEWGRYLAAEGSATAGGGGDTAPSSRVFPLALLNEQGEVEGPSRGLMLRPG